MNLSRIWSFDHLGTTQYAQNLRIAEMTNWTIQQMLEANPDLAQTSDIITLPNATTYGSNSVAIPATMYGQDVTIMKYTGPANLPPWVLGTQIMFLDTVPLQMLTNSNPAWTNGNNNQQYPQYWSWNDDSTEQLFWPYPNDDTIEVTRSFRIMPTAVTAFNADPQSTGGYTMDGTVTISTTSNAIVGVGTHFTGTGTIAAQAHIGDTLQIDGRLYVVATVTDNTHLTITINGLTAGSGLSSVNMVIIGEIPVRFNMMPAYRLAAYLCEDIDDNRYQMLMGQYEAAKANMVDQITKQISAWNAGYANQQNPNQLFNVQSCFPYRTNGGFGVGLI